MKALAIDFGGTHATLGVIEDCTILAAETIDTDRAKSLAAVLPRIAETFQSLLGHLSLTARDCAGVGVGFAAIVDSRTGRVLATNDKYPDSKEIDIPAWSQKTLGLPLRIENDARMALLGEFYAGAARDFTEVVMMTLGTGIGGVAMIEGKLLRQARAGRLPWRTHSGSLHRPRLQLRSDRLRRSRSWWVGASLRSARVARRFIELACKASGGRLQGTL